SSPPSASGRPHPAPCSNHKRLKSAIKSASFVSENPVTPRIQPKNRQAGTERGRVHNLHRSKKRLIRKIDPHQNLFVTRATQKRHNPRIIRISQPLETSAPQCHA